MRNTIRKPLNSFGFFYVAIIQVHTGDMLVGIRTETNLASSSVDEQRWFVATLIKMLGVEHHCDARGETTLIPCTDEIDQTEQVRDLVDQAERQGLEVLANRKFVLVRTIVSSATAQSRLRAAC